MRKCYSKRENAYLKCLTILKLYKYLKYRNIIILKKNIEEM